MSVRVKDSIFQERKCIAHSSYVACYHTFNALRIPVHILASQTWVSGEGGSLLAYCTTGHSLFYFIFTYFPAISLYLDPRAPQLCVWEKKSSPTGLVSFNMHLLGEMESQLLYLLCCGWFGWIIRGAADAIHHLFPRACACVARAVCVFQVPSLHAVSQPRAHYPFSSSVIVQGLLNQLGKSQI